MKTTKNTYKENKEPALKSYAAIMLAVTRNIAIREEMKNREE